MVSSRLVGASEYRFKNISEDKTSRCMTLNYLNETTIRLLVFPLDTFTLPWKRQSFDVKTLCRNLRGLLRLLSVATSYIFMSHGDLIVIEVHVVLRFHAPFLGC